MKGQSLLEVVVAIGISALVIVGIVSLASKSIQNSTFSRNKGLAATYAQQTSEWLRSQRDGDVVTFRTRIGTWCLISLSFLSPTTSGACGSGAYISEPTGTTIFKRWVTLTQDPSVRIVLSDVKVSWTDSQGTHVVESATNLAD